MATMTSDLVPMLEAKKLIRILDDISYRLENANYGAYNNVLKELLNFIDENKIVKEYVDSCGESTIDLEAEFETPKIEYRYGNPVEMGQPEKEEVANITKFLRRTISNNFKKPIDKGAFPKLISHIRGYLMNKT
jgi:hypothetical protein